MIQNFESEKASILQSLQLILDTQDIHRNDTETARVETNTLSIIRPVLGVVYPRNLEQLQAIVRLANQHRIALYPVSQGKNIGYGEMTPTGKSQLVVGLKHLNTIRSFDAHNGEVVVEPGVTQAQLAHFLKENGAAYWADMTGASPQASLIGNTLESGFGHSPIGDHRKHILQMEVLLADGKMLTTAEMPAIGPDLSQIFVQSNFGIVTAMKIPLYPIPETTVTFAVTFEDDAAFFRGIDVLRRLRKDGTITSLAHIGNATRALMTSSRFPLQYPREKVLSEADCHEILNQNSLIPMGYWSCIGTLYGYRAEVKIKLKRIKKALAGVAKLKAFTDQRIRTIDRVLSLPLANKVEALRRLKKTFASVKALHGISRGQPSNHPSENIFWRVDNFEQLGLLWHAPVIPATPDDCKALLSVARQVYAKYGFEMPVTLTLIDAKHMTAVFNISYDKSSADETHRAHRAYHELAEATNRRGYLPYRCGLVSDVSTIYSANQLQTLGRIKSVLDPLGILAPGRYGIGISK